MNLDWPDVLPGFEQFLKKKNLVCLGRGTSPKYGEKFALYRDGNISVRVLSERGQWFAELSDSAGSPDEWYDPAILRDLIIGPGNDVLTFSEQLRTIENNWSAILESFSPDRREETHNKLAILRHERAKRRFPGWEW